MVRPIVYVIQSTRARSRVRARVRGVIIINKTISTELKSEKHQHHGSSESLAHKM